MRLRIIISIAVLALLSFAACGEGDADEGEEGGANAQVSAAASLEIFADMVRNVGGDRVAVTALLPSGADVHTYEMPPNKVADIAEADIVFINGLALEESFEDVIVTNASGPVVEMAADLPVLEDDEGHADAHNEGDEHEETEEHEHAEGNPHLWLDARLAARYVERIRDELSSLDPDGAVEYEANAALYLEELGELDRAIEEAVLTILEENRRLVTFHDAFPYFAARYGLNVEAVVVPSAGQEPSAQDVAELTKAIEGLPAVFKEPQFSADILELAAEDASVPVYDLLSDAYVDGVDSYIELMRFNRDQLVEGLGGG